jgi:hypothetical protein
MSRATLETARVAPSASRSPTRPTGQGASGNQAPYRGASHRRRGMKVSSVPAPIATHQRTPKMKARSAILAFHRKARDFRRDPLVAIGNSFARHAGYLGRTSGLPPGVPGAGMTLISPPGGGCSSISRSTPRGGQMTPLDSASRSLRSRLPRPTVGGTVGGVSLVSGRHDVSGPGPGAGRTLFCWAAATPIPAVLRMIAMKTAARMRILARAVGYLQISNDCRGRLFRPAPARARLLRTTAQRWSATPARRPSGARMRHLPWRARRRG